MRTKCLGNLQLKAKAKGGGIVEIWRDNFNFKDYAKNTVDLWFENQMVISGGTVRLIDKDAGIDAYFEVVATKPEGDNYIANLKLVKLIKSTTIDLQTHGVENKTTLVKK